MINIQLSNDPIIYNQNDRMISISNIYQYRLYINNIMINSQLSMIKLSKKTMNYIFLYINIKFRFFRQYLTIQAFNVVQWRCLLLCDLQLET